MLRWLLLALLLACVGANVVDLTESNFDELTSEGIWILKFFTPWCGHCKALAPKYTEAAEQLQGKVYLGEINCDNEKGLAGRFGVRGYPTLKFYEDGDAQDYKGQRSTEELVKFGLKMIEPAVAEVVDAVDLTEVLDKNAVVFAFVSSEAAPPSSAKDLFYAAAKTNRAFLSFASVPSLALIPSTHLPDNVRPEEDDKAVHVVALTLDGPGHILEYPYSEESLQEFISANDLPLVATLASDNFSYLMRLEKRLVIAAVNFEDTESTPKYLSWMRDVSKRRMFAAGLDANAAQQEDFVFVTLDAVKWSAWVNQFVSEPFPKLFVHDYSLSRHFLPSEDGSGITGPEDIEKFLKAVEDGSAKIHGYQWYNPLLYLMMLARWKERNLSDNGFAILLVVILFGIGGSVMLICPDGEEVDDDDKPVGNDKKDDPKSASSKSPPNERPNSATKRRRPRKT